MRPIYIFLISMACLSLGCNSEETLTPVAMDGDSEENILDEAASGIPAAALEELYQIAKNKKQEQQGRWHDRFSPGTITLDNIFRSYPSEISYKLSGVVIGELCPYNWVKGDREFGGGPQITCQVNLYLYGNDLWAYVDFSAAEMKADRSEVRYAGWVYLRYLPSQGRVSIRYPTEGKTFYLGIDSGGDFGGCHDGEVEHQNATSGTLVRKFNIIGDTGGDDISDDTDCSCDTKIYSIELNDIHYYDNLR